MNIQLTSIHLLLQVRAMLLEYAVQKADDLDMMVDLLNDNTSTDHEQ